ERQRLGLDHPARIEGNHLFPFSHQILASFESASDVAGAVDADRRLASAIALDGFDIAQYRRGHMTPAGDEGGETAGPAADDKEVDVVGARHDRNARPRLALVPFRQVAIVDLAVAFAEGELGE